MYAKGDKVRFIKLSGVTQISSGVYVKKGDILTVIEEFTGNGKQAVVFVAKGLTTSFNSTKTIMQDAHTIWSEDVELFSKADAYPFKKGYRVKVLDDSFVSPLTLGPDGNTPLMKGDIVTVLETGSVHFHNSIRRILVYMSSGVSCKPVYTTIAIPNSQCIWEEGVELVTEEASVAPCTCSRTTLLREGCICGSVKRYRSDVI